VTQNRAVETANPAIVGQERLHELLYLVQPLLQLAGQGCLRIRKRGEIGGKIGGRLDGERAVALAPGDSGEYTIRYDAQMTNLPVPLLHTNGVALNYIDTGTRDNLAFDVIERLLITRARVYDASIYTGRHTVAERKRRDVTLGQATSVMNV
jgi:hypothetical protein